MVQNGDGTSSVERTSQGTSLTTVSTSSARRTLLATYVRVIALTDLDVLFVYRDFCRVPSLSYSLQSCWYCVRGVVTSSREVFKGVIVRFDVLFPFLNLNEVASRHDKAGKLF